MATGYICLVGNRSLGHRARTHPQRKAASGAQSGWGTFGGHSAYLLGAAEHMALRAGDAELQQPLLLLKKPTRCPVPALVPQSLGLGQGVYSRPRGPCSPS